MNFDFFQNYEEPYLKTDTGKGVFLAGVTLGMLALGQAETIDSAPIFKQLNFGRMKKRDILRHMSRVPELTKAYHLDYSGMIDSLCARSGEFLLMGKDRDIGVDGNFVFSIAFMNARHFFWTIFKSSKKTEEQDSNQKEV
jgi:hypothetical protein